MDWERSASNPEGTTGAGKASLAYLIPGFYPPTEGRLVIVIAHRLSTIRQADRIVFLDNGEIREVGAHEMMADPTSPYRQFVELQGGTSS